MPEVITRWPVSRVKPSRWTSTLPAPTLVVRGIAADHVDALKWMPDRISVRCVP